MYKTVVKYSFLTHCQLLLGEHGIRSNYGRLTVLKSPDQPKILQGDFIVTTEDREIEIECVSENGKPAAEVQNLIYF